MSAHTPGPWTYGYLSGDISARGELIARCEPGELATTAANARLIAAAPDLLQELRNIADANWHSWLERASPVEFVAWAQNRARAAIAKVEEA
jgi:hypothetical protein